MSTLLVAGILIAIVAVVILLLVRLDQKQKRSAKNQLLQTFYQMGSEHNLNFSSQEILSKSILGLDGVHRKLLVVKHLDDCAFASLVINLKEVKTCSVKKEYGTVNGGDSKVKKLEQYLQKITLHFVLFDKPPEDVVFYHHVDNNLYEIAERESKARHWEAILSKMVAPVKKIA